MELVSIRHDAESKKFHVTYKVREDVYTELVYTEEAFCRIAESYKSALIDYYDSFPQE